MALSKLSLMTLVLCVLLLSGPASAASPARHLSPKHAPAIKPAPKPPTAEAIFVSVLHSEEYAYKGKQVTTSWRSGMANEVEVFHLPAEYGRLQYLDPVAQRGRLLVSDGHQEWQYDPHSHTLRHRRLTPGALDDDDYLSYTLLRANYVLSVSPRPVTWAERKAYLVSIKRPGSLSLARRLWVDAGSGLILKREHYGEDGRLAITVAFTEIAYHPKISPALFDLASLGHKKGMKVVELPSPWEAPVALSAAGQQFGGRAQAWPQLAGYRLIGATKTVVSGRPLLHLRYSDGLNLVSLFEQQRTQTRRPTAVPGRLIRLGTTPTHLMQHGALTTLNWDTQSLNITLMGEGSLTRLRKLAMAAR